MATLLTDLATAQASNNMRTALFHSDKLTPRVFYATAKYTCTGSETSGDVINVISLPIGATILADLSKIITDGTGGTSVAITKIGDAGDDDRYTATSVTVTSAAITAVTSTNAQAVTPYVIAAGNETIKATVTHSGAPTAGKFIVFRLAYILP